MSDNSRRSTLLLLAVDPAFVVDVAATARRAGYVVIPDRYHETGVDALVRVEPAVAVVQIGHAAADSITFDAMAERLGTRVLRVCCATDDDALREQAALIGSRSSFTLLEYTGDADALVDAIDASAH